MESGKQNITGLRGLDASTLKIIAIIGMTSDHIGIVFGKYMPLWLKCILYAFGGLTFPIMAYLLGEGYRYTRNFRNYMLRLLVFALLAQLPYYWVLMRQLNILFTLLLGLLAIYATERIKNPALSVLAVAGLIIVSVFCDWGLMGVPMVLMYHNLKDRPKKIVLPLLLPFAMFALNLTMMLAGGQDLPALLPDLLFLLVGCSLTIPLLCSYNGQRGKPMRYFFYAYYPFHIVVLGLLQYIFFL